MKKATKIVVLVVVIIVMLLGAGVLALNHYVQSPEFKDYLLAKTQEQMAVPLQVETLHASIFSGFELRGLVVKNPQGSQTPNLLDSKVLVFRYKLWPLLQKKVEIETIELDGVSVTLEKAEDGTWNYEKLAKEKEKEPKSVTGEKKDETAATPPSGLELQISRLAVNNLNFLVLKPGGKKLLDVNDLDIHSSVAGSSTAVSGKGDLSITRLAIIDSIEARDVHSPVVVEQQQLKLTDLTGKIEDGTLKGDVIVDLQKEGYPYSTRISVTNVDVGKIGAKFSENAKYLTGKLRLTTDVSGVGGDTIKLKGKGDAHIDSGTLAGIPLLQTVGSLLNIPELQRIQFDEIMIEYAMDNGVIDTPVIKLMSKDIQVTGSGKTDFDFNLNHHFILALSPAIIAKVPKEAVDLFVKRDDGFSTIDFKVTGPASSPKTDLTDKLVKGAANKLIEKGLEQFLGGEKPKKKKNQ